ncbi:MAG: tail fiber domain-containing protein [Chryseobacterium sp.]|jgi:hypothetical protein|uniref:tail fiber domain-containing protein n=1 Tax=Chryseobacterium sp. TaxID=1871047 RepID=UPI0028252610|nr:tail fiber domain-containing protein [Chryseobacterium sp.]MDR2238227.1 tail fiber domain-containing protein [Chryseobacterium sp.]
MKTIKTSLSLLILLGTGMSVAAQNVWGTTDVPTTTSGNVGIATTTPAAKLDINSSSVSALKINHTQILGGTNPTNIMEVYKKINVLSGSPALISWLGTNGIFGLSSLSNTANENRMVYSDGAGNIKSPNIKLYSNPYSNNGIINSLGGISKFDFINIYTGSQAVNLMCRTDNELELVGNLDVMFNVKAISFLSSSDKRLKDNIKPLSGSSPNLLNISSYSYTFKEKKEAEKRNDTQKLHFGFMAQEVEKEFPNLVSIDEKGNYALNYIEFIPLLLNELKDQKKEINDLKTKMEAMEAKIDALAGNRTAQANTVSTSSFSLEQNVPNPFNKETIIRFNAEGEHIMIGVYDSSGRQLQSIPVKKGEKQITVSANTLTPGVYIYNLVANGKLVDSKKMMVTH